MSALLTTLPGDIPGLLLKHSPVLMADVREADAEADAEPLSGGVHACGDGYATAVFEDDEGDPVFAEFPSCGGGLADLLLDLTDPTGRAHAAWWCRWRLATEPFTADDLALTEDAEQGAVMSAAQIDTLVRLVLRLAGRTP